MKKILAAVLLLCASVCAYGQGATILFPPVTDPQGHGVPFVTINFCTTPTTVTNGVCNTPVTVFQNSTLSTPYSSAIQTDGLGNFPPNVNTATAIWFSPAANYCYSLSGSITATNVCYPFSVPVATNSTASFTTLTVSGPKPWIDPTSTAYGAKCDGATDDTAAIRAALAVAVANGGSLVIPEGLTCVIATSSSPALSADLASNTSIIGGVAGGEASRPGGGTTFSPRLLFTGTPAIAIAARGTSGFSLKRVIVQNNNAAFTGNLVDTSHLGTDTRCSGGPCDSASVVLQNNSFLGTANAAKLVNFDKTIISKVIGNMWSGGLVQLAGASGSGSYTNQVQVTGGNIFNGTSGQTAMIQNPGETWLIEGNTFETNACGCPALDNAGGFADTTGLIFMGNWIGDMTGAATYTMFKLPAASTSTFMGNLVSPISANVTGFSVGNNSTLTVTGNNFSAPGTIFGTMYSLGTGESVSIGQNQYATVSSFMSGTPSSGIVQDNTGKITNYGTTLTQASGGNNVTLLNSQDVVGPLTGSGADQTVYTFTVPASTIAAGKGIRVKLWFNHSTGTASVNYKLLFGASQAANSSSTTTGVGYVEAIIMNQPASITSQRVSSIFNMTGTSPSLVGGNAPGENTASGVIVKFTFSVAATDQVTGDQWVVELIQ